VVVFSIFSTFSRYCSASDCTVSKGDDALSKDNQPETPDLLRTRKLVIVNLWHQAYGYWISLLSKVGLDLCIISDRIVMSIFM